MLTKDEYIKNAKLICSKYNCKDCPLYMTKLGSSECITNFLNDVLDDLSIIEDWVEKHPVTTNRDKFEEIYGINLKWKSLGQECENDDPEECIKQTCSICSDCSWWDREYVEPDLHADTENLSATSERR